MGVAVLPFLKFNTADAAVEGILSSPKESEVKIPEDKKLGEAAPEMEKPSTSFVSLLNGIGIISSGLLGALYALAQKEKLAAVATIETVRFYAL